ncbi:bifunctional diaminohydroxyphosphoribosylaminopyrimidine deaminase/5-amino-6-(5-phosphoribosylamino)uracil reductase RibD [Frigidibacter sp. ROC022]|uniref:bifunctional diaminohydroxyphosphoribosylaminopyrimidine deaminase/5-amino-6-(5-phosphoribosylamino)uracil reductase RibD n=1 Tax=Frigidibacter sp. ROC022 TaxID=2971796 RepID=UPI00215A7EF6|nr:bifunctional diaminohydroxyphosphoribosylaminopyrimidine deaminase/5-amino-6-(5-phosphoribosylamino)uracil reductase RibD [Frigidibacter sp. ROC022]MCR8725440.1 bifunctional diaminohydroxyphosphoribosylaminopyrimidine deaminase/5-amino-6-(5-phosphoribosylamino)uracil reductase RibD [Frigidibacter sp. ROC022]
MAHALTLGRRGLGNCWPNPAVGCVITRDGRIVGRGWTQPGGRPHAEVVALAQAGEAARGATAHVTLEPCSHTGKTGPCALALAEAGVARVVIATADPDTRVNGQGLALLRRAGVAVTNGVLEAEALEANRGFFLRITENRPLLTLKLATSFDGRIATASGESRWITGPEARHAVHGLRHCHDAVLVGGGTARADDPGLNVRGYGAVRQPVRVVLSRGLNLDETGKLSRTAGEQPLWLIHGPHADPDRIARWTDRGARCLASGLGPDGQLDPRAALETLAGEGLTRVFCEGGGSLAASLLGAGLVDELVGFTAGLALGAEAVPAIAAMRFEHLADAPRFRLVESRRCGPDVLHRWRPL